MNLNEKKVIVLGAGESGRAAAELLSSRGAQVVLRDGKRSERLTALSRSLAGLGVRVETVEEADVAEGFDFAVLSPGVDPKVSMVKEVLARQTPIMSEIELAFQLGSTPVIAITGTNGKSTTTQLIEAILNHGGVRTEACGNIGKPYSDVVREDRGLDVVTVEVSSFQLEATEKFQPHVSVYLNLTPDHLDRYASLQEYKTAKDRIFLKQQEEDYAVVNADLILPALKAKKITINSHHEQADYFQKDGWLYRGQERILEQKTTELRGPHNAENMLAALAVADIYNIPWACARESLQAYKPLPHRCEKVRILDGVTYINDSKATNTDALEKALMGFVGNVVLIAGGKDKGFDFSSIKTLIGQKVSHAILIGEVKHTLAQVWGKHTQCFTVETIQEAVELSQTSAIEGSTVLLSPGSSSYDMFKNFEDRGDQYKILVNQLKPKQ